MVYAVMFMAIAYAMAMASLTLACLCHGYVDLLSSAVPSGSGAFQLPTRPSSSSAAASTLRGGKGLSQKRFSNFFSFFDMRLLWEDINNIS